MLLHLALAGGVLTFAACGAAVEPSPAGDTSTPQPAASNDELYAEGRSAVLPVFMIDIDGQPIVKDRETTGALTVIEDHDGSLKDLASRAASLRSRVSLEVHGNISTTLDKKSFQLELVDEQLQDSDQQLLGLPAGSDWVLHSCGFDPLCMRNVLVYALGRKLGRYAPRTRFLELFVDDAYQGLYVLIERVRRDKHRVNLPRPARTPSDGDITGGYIFKMDLGEGTPADPVPRDWVSPVSQMVYSYYYPRFDEISDAQKTYLRDHMSRFEALMRGSMWNDPREGYGRWLDIPSWVDFALIQELSVNPDAYFKSVYFQKWPRSMGDKIAIGPFWDFDLAFGVAEFRDAQNTQAWAHAMNRFGSVRVPNSPTRDVPFVPDYWERLWTDPAFQRHLRCRWQDLRQGPLQVDELNAVIDGWMRRLAVALPRDAARWVSLPKPRHPGGTESLREFLGKRLAWMDANLPGRCAA